MNNNNIIIINVNRYCKSSTPFPADFSDAVGDAKFFYHTHFNLLALRMHIL